MRLNKTLFTMLYKIGITTASYSEKQQLEKREAHKKIKELKKTNHLLLMENQKLKKIRRGQYYPKDREYLKERNGEEIELDGIFVSTANEKMLISMVEHNGVIVCDHLWIHANTYVTAGDLISIKGTICKYGTMKNNKVKENYGLCDPVVTKVKGNKK